MPFIKRNETVHVSTFVVPAAASATIPNLFEGFIFSFRKTAKASSGSSGRSRYSLVSCSFGLMRQYCWPRIECSAHSSQHPIALLHRLGLHIHLIPHLLELLRHLRHALLLLVQRRRVIPHILRDLHRAEFRAAHRAEMRDLVGFL